MSASENDESWAGDSEECQILLALRSHPDIFAAIAQSTASELKNQRRLREQFDDDLVRAALALHDARQIAARKLPHGDKLWLTRVGLEQSTAWSVAQHKARRFAAADHVVDLCCGIGIDAAALTENCNVSAIDLDPAMVLRCEWNSRILSANAKVSGQCMDVTSADWSGQWVHADPDRRAGRDRPAKRLEQYQPGLEWMQDLTTSAVGGAIKISPASNFIQKFPGCEIELISLDGECREATVWFGELAGPNSFRATILPTGESISIDPLSAWAPQANQCDAYLFDPDPSVVRSGMLDGVAELLTLQRLDPEEEYLTGPAPVDSAFVTGFRIEAVLPNNLRELKRWLRKDPSTYYEVKCRHIPTDAASLQKQLPTGTAEPRTILIARIAGKARIVVARRVTGLRSSDIAEKTSGPDTLQPDV